MSIEIRNLLTHPECPWAHLARAGESKAILVDSLVSFAQRLGHRETDRAALEAELERWIDAHGGERQTLIDPWHWIARKLRMTSEPKAGDIFIVPSSALEDPS